MATGCDGSKKDPGYVDDDRSISDDSTGCEGEPGPGSISDSSGCEGDMGPSDSGGGGVESGCEGDPAVRSVRTHAPLLLIGMVVALRRRRRKE